MVLWIFQGCCQSEHLNDSYDRYSDFQNKGLNIIFTPVNKSKPCCEPCQLLNCSLDNGTDTSMRTDFKSIILLSLRNKFEVDCIIKSNYKNFQNPISDHFARPVPYPEVKAYYQNVALMAFNKTGWLEILFGLLFLLLLIYVMCYFCIIIKIWKYLI